MANEANTRSASDVEVKVNGKEISLDHLVSFMTQADFGQPDMCTLTIRNEDHGHANSINLTDEVVIRADRKPIFIGEVVGLEPIYTSRGENSVMVRAFNKLHALLRSMQSQTFVQQNDEEIITRILGKHGLKCECGDKAKVKHEHVYQHNQKDLEFLRIRAARLGYEIWVTDNRIVHVDEPDTSKSPAVTAEYGDAASCSGLFLEYFSPRLASGTAVQTAEVRGWDARKKEPIVATVKATDSRTGGAFAHAAAGKFKSATPIFTVDHPVADVAEAKKIAEGMIRNANLNYMTGSGECRGSPDVKLGEMIGITVNRDGDDRFNGNYLVVGVTHKYSPQKGNGRGGYTTGFRVQRDSENAPRSGGK